MRACARDFAASFLARTLKTELNMIDAGFDECGEFPLIKWKAAGDKADIEPGFAGGAHEFDDVIARQRFATGEVGLENSDLCRFMKNTNPGFCGKFYLALGQFEWIRAIDAVKRAAVREFGYES